MQCQRNFQFIGNFKVTQYVETIVGRHFQLLGFHIEILGMAGKQCFFCPKGWERSLFSGTFGQNFNFKSVDTLFIVSGGREIFPYGGLCKK